MSKLQRKSAKLFAENASAGIGGVAQFGSLAAGAPNYSKDVDIIQALDAFKNGWSSAVTGNKSPAIEDRNALDYLLSYQQAYIMQMGIPEWLSTETYYQGSFASLSDGRLFVSKVNNNTNQNPDTDTTETYWIKFPTPYELSLKANKDFSNIDNTAKTQIIPVGALMMGPVSSMSGFLLCNGQAVSRTTYSALFAAIGTNFGTGDGSTTFNVPDYRGCFLRGLGGDSAADVYTKQATALPNITGYDMIGWSGESSGPINNMGSRSGALSASPEQATSARALAKSDVIGGSTPRGIAIDASLSSSVYQNNISEARPVNFAINYFIKY